MFKKPLSFLLFILLIVNGCAGRQPTAIQTIQDGDEQKSCKEIDLELEAIRSEIEERYPKIKDTKNYNLGVGLFGSLFPPLVPFVLFSDIKKADSIELNALQKRNNHLVKTERKIGCGFEHFFMSERKIETIFP